MTLYAFSLIGWVSVSHGFGAEAHRIVGNVADRYTCTGTRKSLDELIPGEPLSEAGLWADRIRGDETWDRARPWHYMNVPDDTAIADRTISTDGDVLLAIEHFRTELANPELSVEQHRIALRFLVHFVADIHQPLHVGRKSDLGGNAIKIRAGREETNLHTYWDSYALEQVVESAPVYAASLAGRGYPDPGAAEPATWATESKAYRDEVYAYPRNEGSGAAEPDAAYQARAVEIIDLRLYQAGVRLARLLNGIFCPEEGQDSPR
ncbi:MAG: S1/P1 nuclease [Gammaproteobacteria bacterium]|jgi:hypothetical protein|nr:S1/P1 nuclease [Gammaproteobacteria bacterium]MDP6616003.1 S1/P1 nuclease [Gammaproteobacteria bacterium]MDP6695159.1 S1/P1 nuclease [Gammaproteobacteria bacterium]MDP7041896.1 S1/P1 nuclease [Gammaproteobacteria bacterium]